MLVVAAAIVLCLAYSAVAFAPSKAKTTLKTALKMAGTPMFDPKEEAGVAPPFGFFDPLGKL